MNEQSLWLTLLIALIPATASIGAAITAGLYARAAKRADAEAQRTRDLEDRISERKYEIYKPMINALRDAFNKNKDSDKKVADLTLMMADFSTWISIYGSDESVTTFHNIMQASYSNAPPAIFLRLYGDFLLAARKDMGYPETKVDREHLLGLRINDIYEKGDVIDPSFEEVCERLDWQPPWLHSNVVPREILT